MNWRTKFAILAVVAALIFIATAACTDSEGATEALSAQGYEDIEITGYSAFTCGDDYDKSTGFEATVTLTGVRVEGAYCSNRALFGWGKGGTIKIKGVVD